MKHANETREQIEKTLSDIVDRYQKIYNDFSAEVELHAKSKHSIPEVSKKLSLDKVRAVDGMRAINEATYEGQKITNLYYTIYAPKLSELYYDAKSCIAVLEHAFMTEPKIQEIKTNAEKERQCNNFMFEANQLFSTITKLSESAHFLGKYVESIIYALGRMQNMIDSLDKLQSKEIWVDSKANEQSINEIATDSNINPQDYKRTSNDDLFEDFE